MKMSIGEVIDRYSICKLKTERLGLDNSKEMELLMNEIKKYDYTIMEYIEKLYTINGNIWNLEADIRQGKIDTLGFEEIGRRAIQIRDFNNQRVETKNEITSKFNDGFIETKMDHGSEKQKSLIITLTTVPERLANPEENGVRAVIKSLCEQNDSDYEIHFNIPEIYNMTQERYVIPDWLHTYKLQYPHLKVFRVDDIGPPTKFIPTLHRITDPETILLTVDDDLIYHPDMVTEHRKYQNHLVDSVICYEGRGVTTPTYYDHRDAFLLCVDRIVETNGLQHYKSASYKKKLFDNDFEQYYLGRTLSDDVLVSRYFKDKKIKMFVVPYENDVHLFTTFDSWKLHSGVETFPVMRHSHSPSQTGCSHPEILKIEPRFYDPPNIGNKTFVTIPRHTLQPKKTEDVMVSSSPVKYKPSNLIELFKTYDVNSPKIRIGNPHDGGYVINELLAQHTKRLISIGMGTEDSFERDWLSRYPDKPIEAYDACCPCSDLCYKNPEQVHKTIFYVQQNVGYEPGNIPLNNIVDGKQNVLLKVDVETAEYKIFDNVNLTDVTGLIIEIHDLDVKANVDKLTELMMQNFADLVLFHVHGNSWGKTFDLNISKNPHRPIIMNDFPRTVELTFIHKKLITTCELETKSFPDPLVDMSNNSEVPDIDLYWINAL